MTYNADVDEQYQHQPSYDQQHDTEEAGEQYDEGDEQLQEEDEQQEVVDDGESFSAPQLSASHINTSSTGKSSSSSSYEEKTSSLYNSNSNTSSTPFIPRTIDVKIHADTGSKYHDAFGELQYVKIAETLQSSDISLKVQSLQTVLSLLHRAENIPLLITHGVFGELVVNTSSHDSTVRELCTQALIRVAQSRAGRTLMLDADLLPRLIKLLCDSSAVVRQHTASILLHILNNHQTNLINTVLATGLPAVLIQQFEQERNFVVKSLLLQLLVPILRARAGYDACVLQQQLIPTAARTLHYLLSCYVLDAANVQQVIHKYSDKSHEQHDVNNTVAVALQCIAHVCQIIGYAAVYAAGKQQCVNEQHLLIDLQTCYNYPHTNVRVYASFAVMNLVNDLHAKRAAIECGFIQQCIVHIHDAREDTVVKSQSLQILASLAEHPLSKTAHENLLRSDTSLHIIEQVMQQTRDPSLKLSAQTALQKIQWKP